MHIIDYHPLPSILMHDHHLNHYHNHHHKDNNTRYNERQQMDSKVDEEDALPQHLHDAASVLGTSRRPNIVVPLSLESSTSTSAHLDNDAGEEQLYLGYGFHSANACSLTYEQIALYFNIPMYEAALELDISLTSLRERCRDLGISRYEGLQELCFCLYFFLIC